MTKPTMRPKRSTAPKNAPAPTENVPSAQPDMQVFLHFHHSATLRQTTLAILDQVEQASDATRHSEALADVIVELIGTGMDELFMKPLKLAEPRFLLEQTANLGLGGVQQAMATVIRKIIGNMNTAQLQSICTSIRQFML